MKQIYTIFLIVFFSLISVSCAVNPVTGESQFSLLSRQDEIAIGNEQYGPAQQSQGGQYTVDFELTRYVNEVGQRLADQAKRDYVLPYEFVVLNNSVPNAWALPGGKIAVNRGLLMELDNEAELAAVLGHEVVHAAARHGATAMSRGQLLQGVLTVGAIASQEMAYSDYIVGAGQLGAQLISQRYGRDAEREADYYGIQYMVQAGYDPRAAVSLQETFVRLSEGRDSSWIDGLFASHPPSEERVANNQALVDEIMPLYAGVDLELGEARYQQALARLRADQEAYGLFDEAQRAIADDDLDIAMLNLNQAISLVPNEARFSGLKADIQLYQEDYREAIASYSEAILKDAQYFDYYLGRGVAYSRLGDQNRARQDLERSTELLPTSTAMNELGKIALNNNNRNQAKQYFQTAAGGGGAAATEAALAFTRLDLVDNPGNYVQVQTFTDDQGRVRARVSNQAGIPVTNIQIEFTAAIDGELELRDLRVNSLGANQSVNLNTGLRFPEGVQITSNLLRVRVTGVQAAQ
ncbi:MAG: peptidase M48 [Gammaproteobacteria bacterium]|nr:peptidase M48 [Gammaproteobacteria bacterium]|tara:strand:+ start:337493 stop:339061 length:1569 start_codon:yes stop_codon:yes gene_type:complete